MGTRSVSTQPWNEYCNSGSFDGLQSDAGDHIGDDFSIKN